MNSILLIEYFSLPQLIRNVTITELEILKYFENCLDSLLFSNDLSLNPCTTLFRAGQTLSSPLSLPPPLPLYFPDISVLLFIRI